MAEHRPFPPSPRRRALARQAGLHAASPVATGAVACGAAVLVVALLGPAASARAGAWIAAASRDEAVLGVRDALGAVLELAAPVLVAAAVAALIAHVAQVRAVWLPRRAIAGAPALDRGAGARTRRAAFELVSALVVGGVVFGWLWLVAPRIARLPSVPLAGGLLVTSAIAAIATAWIAVGVLDALVRHLAVDHALRMSEREKREDDRLAGADPRWRAHRSRSLRIVDRSAAVAGSTLLVLGDDTAVAVAWDPVRRPIPVRTATGRRAAATQLLGLARRHRIAVHRDPALAAALVDGDGPIPEAHWPRLAEIVAAVRRS